MKKERQKGMKGRKILIGVTGCIAAYKACELVSRLRQGGAEIRVVMTVKAREFVAPLSFRVLSGGPVFTDMFEAPRAFDPAHVSLAEWADIVVLAPATANSIGKIACGLADDLLSCVVMATKAPVLFAPAMNVNMYENRIVQENIRKLKAFGYSFVGPEEGHLACGYEGAGRLAATEAIISSIAELM
jgi:phosphopantothenoylcysteine decarboxylase/phosphopantothenate--cysteine ligase